MRAVQAVKPGQIQMVEVDIPQIETPTQVRIKVRAAGICGSDIHIAHGTNPYATYPRILGHEIVGVVEDMGSAVTTLHAGDHVVLEPIIYCGRCYPCSHGRPNVCEHLQVRGVHQDGGFAEYLVSEERYLHRIPDDLDLSVASLIEPYTIGAQANARAHTQEGDTVLIHGAGPIGLIALDVAKSLGAVCIVSEISEERCSMARRFGADVVINPQKTDLKDEVMSVTKGRGVNVVHEATGVSALLAQSAELASAAGRIVAFSFGSAPISIDFSQVNKKELSILGTRHQSHMFPRMIEYVAANAQKAGGLITHRFALEEYRRAFELFADKRSGACKVILTMEN